jgi:DMSO/TMAO reductase YedYZ molybdopterin-dependent catalytic subunit
METEIDASSLIPRGYDSQGRVQMAEGHIDRHTSAGTAIEDMFVVHHYDQPELPTDHKIHVVGANHVSWTITPDDLRTLGQRDEVALLECAGNGRGLRARRAPGNQFGLGLFGQARWTGVSLAAVLGARGLTDEWTCAVIHGPDEGVTKPEGTRAMFGKGLPRDKAVHPDTLLAWEVDGAAIPASHGGPVRLVVPGWYGIWWVKWVTRIELTNADFHGFWQNERYTYQDEEGRISDVVAEQLPRAVILSPRDWENVSDDNAVRGLAWAGEQEVAEVDLSIDDGQTWKPGRIVERTGRWGWVRWEAYLPAGLPRGLRRVAARARDVSGRTQDWEPSFNRLGYGNNGIHRITIDLVASYPGRLSGARGQ